MDEVKEEQAEWLVAEIQMQLPEISRHGMPVLRGKGLPWQIQSGRRNVELQAPCPPQRSEKLFEDAWYCEGKQFDFQIVPSWHGNSHGTFWTLHVKEITEAGEWKNDCWNRYVDEDQVLDAVLTPVNRWTGCWLNQTLR